MSSNGDADGALGSMAGRDGPTRSRSPRQGAVKDESVDSTPGSPGHNHLANNHTSANHASSSSSSSPADEFKSRSPSCPPVKAEPEEDSTEQKIGGEITVKLEPGKPPKLSRTASRKVVSRPPSLFNHLPDSSEEACKTFEVIEDCVYSNKYIGYTEHSMDCDCVEEWGKFHQLSDWTHRGANAQAVPWTRFSCSC